MEVEECFGVVFCSVVIFVFFKIVEGREICRLGRVFLDYRRKGFWILEYGGF